MLRDKKAARGGRDEQCNLPTSMMTKVVRFNVQLARLCRKGILFVRITWMMSVCVSSDSTNQPV
jgi:hypothetical protein